MRTSTRRVISPVCDLCFVPCGIATRLESIRVIIFSDFTAYRDPRCRALQPGNKLVYALSVRLARARRIIAQSLAEIVAGLSSLSLFLLLAPCCFKVIRAVCGIAGRARSLEPSDNRRGEIDERVSSSLRVRAPGVISLPAWNRARRVPRFIASVSVSYLFRVRSRFHREIFSFPCARARALTLTRVRVRVSFHLRATAHVFAADR